MPVSKTKCTNTRRKSEYVPLLKHRSSKDWHICLLKKKNWIAKEL